MGKRERNLMREEIKRLEEIEQQLRRMQKEWIDMYETVLKMINENKATDYEKDQKHDND